MSKLIMWNLMSLDGYFEGSELWALDWFQTLFDDELQEHTMEQLRVADSLIFGRTTYEGMAAYWQPATGEIADFMNTLPKFVVSRTLGRTSWQNTTLIKDNVAAEVRKIKSAAKKNVYVFGSANLSSTLVREGLFDEYTIGLVPVVLGSGKTLFGRNTDRLKLKLLESRPLSSGCVILRYAPSSS